MDRFVQDIICTLPWYELCHTQSFDIEDQEYKHSTQWQTYRFFFWGGVGNNICFLQIELQIEVWKQQKMFETCKWLKIVLESNLHILII